MQSYAVDKKLRTEDLPLERVDVITGAVLTGDRFFVVVACAATLHRDGLRISDAADAAVALQPLAGEAAATLFGVGLIGASFLAASILPLSTAYSVCEYAGVEAAIDDPYREARTFYLTYGIITLVGTVIVLTPELPLVAILVGTGAQCGAVGAAAGRNGRAGARPQPDGRLRDGPGRNAGLRPDHRSGGAVRGHAGCDGAVRLRALFG